MFDISTERRLSSRKEHRPERNPRADPRMEQAIEICAKRGGRFTPFRHRVYEVLCAEARALSAYQLLAFLEAEAGKRIGPPPIYRALAFLEKHGLIARLESRNAYVAYSKTIRAGPGVFFICTNCGTIDERTNAALEAEIAQMAEVQGFHLARRVIELEGTCARCLGKNVASASNGCHSF